MSAFPHPNLGPTNPDPVVLRRLRLASAITVGLLSGSILLIVTLELGTNFFADSDHRARSLALGLGITLVAGGMALIMWAFHRARRAVTGR
jgi:protein-S-isoprenylcysteine O-methyltransferase Ste14